MPKIEIIERDETSAGVFDEKTDVVYIPGLVDLTQDCLYSDENEYVGIEANVPTLFTSLKAFESLCGKRGYEFTKDQYYYDLADATSNGFEIDAVPYHRVMFKKGSIDPSYVMAKELLAAGLNVVYERLNSEDVVYEALETVPNDFDTNKKEYFKREIEYVPIRSSAAPIWYSKIELDSKFGSIEEISSTSANKVFGTKNFLKFDYDVVINLTETATIEGESIDVDGVLSYERNLLNSQEDGFELSVGKDILTVKAGNEFKFFVTVNDADLGANVIDEAVSIDFADGVDRLFKGVFVKDDKNNDVLTSFAKVTTPIKYATLKGFINSNDTYYEYDGSDYFDKVGETYVSVVIDNEVLKVAPADWGKSFLYHYEADYKYTELTNSDVFVAGEVFSIKDSTSIDEIYSKLSEAFDANGKLNDKGGVQVKYLTSGGYPTFEYKGNTIVEKMISIAETRGDCVAIIDHTNNPYRESNISKDGSVYKLIKSADCQGCHSEFATMFTPWFEFSRTTVDKDDSDKIIESDKDNPLYGLTSIELPGSFAYLITLADSIKTNANWLAVAGSARGVVQNIALNGAKTKITNGAADDMQPRDGVAVNAITNINPYGYTIWGNRTLKDNSVAENLTATSFLNIRNLISDVKKQAYKVSRQLTFEQNNEVLWVNFKSLISSLLDRMVTGYGISGYKIERDTAHERYDEKATLCAKITLYPVYAVEDFYITIVLKDDEVSVE